MKVYANCLILALIAHSSCDVYAFVQASTRSRPRSSPKTAVIYRFGRQRHRHISIVSASPEEDDEILRELRKAKKELYGADIPADEELKQAAVNAENAFLAAMLEQTQQFKQIKSEQGSDRAVQEFMKRIQDEQNPGDEEVQKDEGDNTEDSVDGKWFVQRMQEEQNPGMIPEDDDSSWQ